MLQVKCEYSHIFVVVPLPFDFLSLKRKVHIEIEVIECPIFVEDAPIIFMVLPGSNVVMEERDASELSLELDGRAEHGDALETARVDRRCDGGQVTIAHVYVVVGDEVGTAHMEGIGWSRVGDGWNSSG